MTTDTTELAHSLKAAAKKATKGRWVAFTDTATKTFAVHTPNDKRCENIIKWAGFDCQKNAKANAEFIALANPANALALVEALELKEEQRANWFQMAKKLGEDLDAAEKRNAESESSGIAPGILRCSECSFVQTKNIISVTADTITTVESESELCPNGCGPLQPVTWKALAIQLMFTTKQGVSDFLEAKKRIAELEEAEQKLCAANVTLDARAELAECRLAEMESRTVTIEPFRSFVTDADLAALHRFAECCDDPESGGHDLEQEQVRRLEAIGALQRSGRISYITSFGDVLISITAGIKWEAE
ncbi:ead/Ea22-like family protein [Klebsiella michiganensis]|uniref:ead/Ea22-like family protein n=1 Tax=Klebsiella grimontii TaxID=2058152 RepID=UPI0012B8BC36|nr:ead/Ea22-like family protein [Klebsiella grimontii]ELT1805676.1 ead/Ea22-like family protein [Klebsiella michiganensis]